MRRFGIIAHFYKIFSVLFNKRQLDSHVCFFIQFIMIYVVLVEVYAENLSHKDNGREKEKYLIDFSDDCGYSPLIRHQNSTSSS